MRTTDVISQEEVQAYKQFADAFGIVADQSADAIHNANLVHSYFTQTWREQITEANLKLAFEQLRPYLKFYLPHQKEFSDLFSALSEKEKEAFVAWKGAVGLKDSYKNGATLLGYIRAHGWTVDKKHLQLAVGQKVIAPLLEWDVVAQQKPKGHAGHQDDGKGFLSTPDANEPLWKRRQREREAADKANGIAPVADVSTAAQREAETLQGNSHHETTQIQRVLVTTPGTTVVDWPATLQARLNLQASLNKQQAVRRFVR